MPLSAARPPNDSRQTSDVGQCAQSSYVAQPEPRFLQLKGSGYVLSFLILRKDFNKTLSLHHWCGLAPLNPLGEKEPLWLLAVQSLSLGIAGRYLLNKVTHYQDRRAYSASMLCQRQSQNGSESEVITLRGPIGLTVSTQKDVPSMRGWLDRYEECIQILERVSQQITLSKPLGGGRQCSLI